MGLFKSDLYRSFGIGFAFGALIVISQIAPQFLTDPLPQAIAATENMHSAR